MDVTPDTCLEQRDRLFARVTFLNLSSNNHCSRVPNRNCHWAIAFTYTMAHLLAEVFIASVPVTDAILLNTVEDYHALNLRLYRFLYRKFRVCNPIYDTVIFVSEGLGI